MMRLAYFSPLNPVQSGISDYSEELLPFLARGAEIDLFIDKYRPTNAAISAEFRALPARRFEAEARRRPYDSPVYQMGNSPAHAYIYERLLHTPGVLVLHELVLHHLRMWMALRRGKGRAYQQAMVATYGEPGRQAAERVLLGQNPESLFNFPLVEEALGRATGVIVHSRFMAEQARALRPDVPLAVVNMGVPLPPYIPSAEARARLGIEPGAFVLASMGHLNPYKRLNVALRAFKAFAMREPHSLFLLVGSRSPNYNVDRMIAMLGLQDRVRVIGFAPPARFADYLAAADVCVNLRYPTAGETSAALLRILGAGKPALVSRVGSFLELPDAAAAKVDVGEIEEELLLEYLLTLARRPDLRLAMGRAARRYVAEQHTLEGAAAGYLTFLGELLGRPVPALALAPAPYVDDIPTPEAAAPARPAAPAPALPAEESLAAPTPLRTFALAAADCGLAPEDPALPALLERVRGVL
jgi:glycosyltransferase involved in cell wall biosynthesis